MAAHITAPTPASQAVGSLLSATMLYKVISQAHSRLPAIIFCQVGAFSRYFRSCHHLAVPCTALFIAHSQAIT